MLNKLWISLFVASFLACCFRLFVLGDSTGFSDVIQGMFSMAKTSVEIALGLVGAMSFWMGIMAIAEKAGLVDGIARGLTPLFHRLMPEVPKNHPAYASITMNLSANMMGLDNAATPFGIKAMQDLQSLNPKPTVATNAQLLFLVLNTSSVTLFPVAIFVYRAQQGAADPTDVFIPILLATSASTLAGLLAICFVQRIKLTDAVLLAYAAGFIGLIGGIVVYFAQLSAEQVSSQSALLSNALIFAFIVFCLWLGSRKKLSSYDVFIDGAKQGFQLAVSIIPYLLAMLVAIAALRASGLLDMMLKVIENAVVMLGFDAGFVQGLPTALMKPFSGSGARGMMLETMNTYGVDAFPSRVAAVVQGSTETTFYVLAVYFGAVGIKHARHGISCALFADAAGISAAIAVCYWFYA